MAVRHGLDERRPVAVPCPFDDPPGRPVHLLGVVAVDQDRLEAVGGSPVRGRMLHRGHRPDRRVLHVLVVLADEDDRGLPDRGHVQRLVEGADVRRPVAEEADRHLAGLAVLGGPRGAERDREVGADDGVRTHHVVVHVGDVHRAALAAEQAVRPAEQLGVERAHRRAAGQGVVVAAVRRERVVVVVHRRREPCRDRFLARPEVGRPPNEALEEELLRADLEGPALDHDPVQPQAGLDVHGRRVSRHWRRTARLTGTW